MAVIKVRCPVCGGCGGVEPSFGTGSSKNDGASNISVKPCPACGGTGMQEIEYNPRGKSKLPRVDPCPPSPTPIPPQPWYFPAPQTQKSTPCDTCWFTQEVRRKGHYVGDVPCTWCQHSPHKVTFITTNPGGSSSTFRC